MLAILFLVVVSVLDGRGDVHRGTGHFQSQKLDLLRKMKEGGWSDPYSRLPLKTSPALEQELPK